jgi:hypothetical protein
MLQVRLLSKDGKQLALLPLTQGALLQDFDPRTGFSARRGRKMILAVVNTSMPTTQVEFDPANIMGVSETWNSSRYRPTTCPRARWATRWSTPSSGSTPTPPPSRAAARASCRRCRSGSARAGGLVVCQPDEPYRIAALADMLPVELKNADNQLIVDSVERKEPEPLHTLATERACDLTEDQRKNSPDLWYQLKGPFKVARGGAQARRVRRDVGRLDQGRRRAATRPTSRARHTAWGRSRGWRRTWAGRRSQKLLARWPHVWDRVFGWKNKTTLIRVNDVKNRKEVWNNVQDAWLTTSMADLGGTLLSGMDHSGKAGAYVFLVILFFIGYWIVAGRAAICSWPARAAATELADLRRLGDGGDAADRSRRQLLLRGEPEVRHVTTVRLAPGAPAVVESRVGLYIRATGRRPCRCATSTPTRSAPSPPWRCTPSTWATTAASPTPSTTGSTCATSTARPASTSRSPTAARSRNSRCTGSATCPAARGIVGDPTLVEAGSVGDVNSDGRRDGYIGGQVANKTGYDLKNVFFAFTYQAPASRRRTTCSTFPCGKRTRRWTCFRVRRRELLIGDEKFDKSSAARPASPPAGSTTSGGPNLLKSVRSPVQHRRHGRRLGPPVRTVVVVMTPVRPHPAHQERACHAQHAGRAAARGGRELDMSHLLAAGQPGDRRRGRRTRRCPTRWKSRASAWAARAGGSTRRRSHCATAPGCRGRPAEPEPAATAPAAAPVETPQSQ